MLNNLYLNRWLLTYVALKSIVSCGQISVGEEGTSFIKTMFFEDMDSMQKTVALSKGEGKPIADLFYSFANDVSRQTYIQKT